MACQKVCKQGRNSEGTKKNEVEPSRAMVKCSRQCRNQAGAHWHAKSLFMCLGFHFECLCDQQHSWLPCYNCKTNVKKQAGIRLDSTTLYHASTWLYLVYSTLLHCTMALLRMAQKLFIVVVC